MDMQLKLSWKQTLIYMHQIFQFGEAIRIKLKVISYKLVYGRLGPGVFSYGKTLDYLQENG